MRSAPPDPASDSASDLITCQRCGVATRYYDFTNWGQSDGSYRELCCVCVNQEVAVTMGLEHFESSRFAPVLLSDARGIEHRFHFRLRLFGHLALEAFELIDGVSGGYQFQILDEPEADPWELLARMIERIRRTLAITHLSDVGGGLSICGSTLRGRIESESSGWESAPVLIIDGKEVSWDQFGRMLMSFEGWQFKLNILDRSEEP